jgi:GNAT superfamily N-acetyltransferase
LIGRALTNSESAMTSTNSNDPGTRPSRIRPCEAADTDAMLAIINAGAEAYRGQIPADCWHEPYMTRGQLLAEVAAGVAFVGQEVEGNLAGVMGIQPVRNVDLIRHAYVLPAHQGQGIGGALMRHLRDRGRRQILVGTWAAATWAIGFYQRHGFQLLPVDTKTLLLRTYWTIPDRQIETSVVLAAPALTPEAAANLVAQVSGATPT